MSEWDVDDFEKVFPTLYNEMRTRPQLRTRSDALRGFMPGPIDYLSRCSNNEEAIRVVNYLLARGELNDREAAELRSRIAQEGVRGLVEKREEGYYLRRFGAGART
ncbi:MAG: DUF2095 family protein [Thaumarchaeota archaeon]|nr:DUF2095 family protein [Candidatus Calditenuaceae archaeon]MDW8186484.1 DUF2095 family protein [Nitrososphaerota archaeon]